MITLQQSKQQLQKLKIMPKVKLLKQVGDHTVGTELDIEDPTVIAKWEELGVIAKPKATKEKDESKDK